MSDDDHAALLARIDERVTQLQKDLHTFVTRYEFKPVQMIAFGLAGLVLATVLATVLAKVLVR